MSSRSCSRAPQARRSRLGGLIASVQCTERASFISKVFASSVCPHACEVLKIRPPSCRLGGLLRREGTNAEGELACPRTSPPQIRSQRLGVLPFPPIWPPRLAASFISRAPTCTQRAANPIQTIRTLPRFAPIRHSGPLALVISEPSAANPISKTRPLPRLTIFGVRDSANPIPKTRCFSPFVLIWS